MGGGGPSQTSSRGGGRRAYSRQGGRGSSNKQPITFGGLGVQRSIQRFAGLCHNCGIMSSLRPVSVRYKETPRGPANPMQAPGPNPCPALVTCAWRSWLARRSHNTKNVITRSAVGHPKVVTSSLTAHSFVHCVLLQQAKLVLLHPAHIGHTPLHPPPHHHHHTAHALTCDGCASVARCTRRMPPPPHTHTCQPHLKARCTSCVRALSCLCTALFTCRHCFLCLAFQVMAVSVRGKVYKLRVRTPPTSAPPHLCCLAVDTELCSPLPPQIPAGDGCVCSWQGVQAACAQWA